MSTAKCIEVIYKMLLSKMTEHEAKEAIAAIVSNKISDLADAGKLTDQNLDAAMNEEAKFYIKAQSIAM